MGTVISQPIFNPTSYFTSRNLIDGQQRITTFVLFFKALSLVLNNNSLFDSNFKFTDSNGDTHLKLKTNYFDEPFLDAVVNLSNPNYLTTNNTGNITNTNKKPKKLTSNILNAYNYILGELLNSNNNKSLNTDYNHLCIVNGLQFVNMVLDSNDDPQLYFDSINSLGVSLNSGDIIKNYVFQQSKRGYNDYQQYWEPVFDAKGVSEYWHGKYKGKDSGRMNLFLHFYVQILANSNKSNTSIAQNLGTLTKSSSVAQHIKDCASYLNWSQSQLRDDIIEYAKIFARIRLAEPDNVDICNNFSLNDKLARLGYLIEKFKKTTVIPYLMYVVRNASTKDAVCIADYLESYLMRRAVCANIVSKNFNKFFTDTLIGGKTLTIKDLKSSLRVSLGVNGSAMPTDNDIKSSFSSLMFLENETPKALLCLLEAKMQPNLTSFIPKGYTLEHIMPQDGTNWAPNHNPNKVYRIGNMTLLTQSLNSQASNNSWVDKFNGWSKNGRVVFDGYRVCARLFTTMNNSTTGHPYSVIPPANSIGQWTGTEIDSRDKQIIDDIISHWKY